MNTFGDVDDMDRDVYEFLREKARLEGADDSDVDCKELDALEQLEASLEEGTTEVDEELAALMEEANLVPSSSAGVHTKMSEGSNDGRDELEALMLELDGQGDVQGLSVMGNTKESRTSKSSGKEKNLSLPPPPLPQQQLSKPPPPIEIAEIPPNAAPSGDSAYANRIGYLLYKEGRLDEAKLWSRYAKTGSASSSTSASSGTGCRSPGRRQPTSGTGEPSRRSRGRGSACRSRCCRGRSTECQAQC